ncbi:MAG: DUF885 domain-containing protein [Bryobacteraceae bacterium]|nr:DUF885 domain-containing protein [Bryobacteraceae bacterium]
MHRSLLAFATISISYAAPAEWVERSNQYARIVLSTMARFSPEGAGSTGMEGVDDQVSILTEARRRESLAALRKAAADLKRKLDSEKDARVRQDLEIILEACQDNIRGSELSEKYSLPYPRIAQIVFGGLRGLLDDQVAASRRAAALVRLRKYAGMEPGHTPIAVQAERRVRERLRNAKLLGPFREAVEQDLARSATFLDGIGQLFEKYRITGFEGPLAKLKEQVAAYNAFVKKEVLPRARTDFRLPPELYAFSLRQYGVDIEPAELIGMARAEFTALQTKMDEVAAKVAEERGWKKKGYRDVISELKKEQLVGDAILAHYQQRLAQMEAIVKRENLVTLPGRPARIRISSAAETAAQPAPNMRPPRLIGNTGESGEFVLPLNIPDKTGKSLQYDDFTFAAASWTLTAHELRPGHEMQFAKMVEAGVSTARAVFAFNSTNVEGWGLYAEAFTRPYMPAEGQLISLQFLLARAARAFLDPELQLGKVTADQARRVLMEDVVLSEAMARQEVERYTFRAPGQATSYYYGYRRLIALREDVERALGAKFESRRFHDFILAQGLLPPALLRKAVMREFVQ